MITPEHQKARYSIAELIAAADDYFDGIGSNQIVMRKPYDHPSNANAVTALMAVIQGSGVAPNDVVVDFGCGTCWLSKILAYYGCKVHAMDVSSKALEIGRKLISSDPLIPVGHVEFHAFDGENIPLPMFSVDRIFCSASFHHVWNQEKILAEFYRILKPGGIAAFHEPGPKHSEFAQSQMEMRDYKVIEENIVIEEIEKVALGLGFEWMQVAFFSPTLELLNVRDFNLFLQKRLPTEAIQSILTRTADRFENLRVFFLKKRGEIASDSRSISGDLRCELIVQPKPHGNSPRTTLEYSIIIKNSGTAVWLPSGSTIGSVNLGVRLFSGESLVARDYFRAPVSMVKVEGGKTVHLLVSVPMPAVPEPVLAFDLVSEGVVWFEMVGNAVVRLNPLTP